MPNFCWIAEDSTYPKYSIETAPSRPYQALPSPTPRTSLVCLPLSETPKSPSHQSIHPQTQRFEVCSTCCIDSQQSPATNKRTSIVLLKGWLEAIAKTLYVIGLSSCTTCSSAHFWWRTKATSQGEGRLAETHRARHLWYTSNGSKSRREALLCSSGFPARSLGQIHSIWGWLWPYAWSFSN